MAAERLQRRVRRRIALMGIAASKRPYLREDTAGWHDRDVGQAVAFLSAHTPKVGNDDVALRASAAN